MTEEPSEDESTELIYLQSDEAEAGHKTMALSELRRQGCFHRAISYDQYYDSYFCQTCNIWAEPACSDERCHFCGQRPVVPSLMKH
jgi:rubrerythrin